MHRISWRCPYNTNHRWYQSVEEVKAYPKCPKCHPRRVDLRRHPHLLAQFDRLKNEGVDPCKLKKHQRIYWQCAVGADHSWVTTVHKRVNRAHGCPYCSGRRLSETNNLLRYVEIAQEWNTLRNGGLKPDGIKSGDRKRYWWSCSLCMQDWQ
jgi:hypothetical protein